MTEFMSFDYAAQSFDYAQDAKCARLGFDKLNHQLKTVVGVMAV